jgi:hypothetical protein
MLAIRHACQALVLVVLASPLALAKEPARPAAAKLSFGGVEYVHRTTTMNGRSDFTPAAQPDLGTWRDRVTIIVRDNVTTPDQLSGIAANLVETVGDLGEVVRTDSAANPRTHETEHFFAAKLQGKDFTQASFARLALVEGKGMVVVYSHRSYGEHSEQSSTGWMDRNGEATERELMSWTGMPKLAQLRALPQSR